MMTHVERTADPRQLRWACHDTLLADAPPGVRQVPASSPLGQLVGTGAITEVAVVAGDVLVRVEDPDVWPQLAPIVHDILSKMTPTEISQIAVAPVSAPAGSAPSIENVQDIVDLAAGPIAAAHGGRLEVVGVNENGVTVRMHGACQGCSGAPQTLGITVATAVRRIHPELTVTIE